MRIGVKIAREFLEREPSNQATGGQVIKECIVVCCGWFEEEAKPRIVHTLRKTYTRGWNEEEAEDRKWATKGKEEGESREKRNDPTGGITKVKVTNVRIEKKRFINPDSAYTDFRLFHVSLAYTPMWLYDHEGWEREWGGMELKHEWNSWPSCYF